MSACRQHVLYMYVIVYMYMFLCYTYMYMYNTCNGYIMGMRDVWNLLHRSPRMQSTRGMRCIPSACGVTILYPVQLTTIHRSLT